MKVTIQNLTINIGHRTAEPSGLLESLLRNATLVPTYYGSVDDDDNANEDTTGETQHNPTHTNEEMVAKAKPQIVEFLQPNEKFSQRTWGALHKAICVTLGVYTHVLTQALRELVADGIVQTKRRRADGETLYSANVGAYVAVPPRQDQHETETTEVPQMVGITVRDLVEFLKSDDLVEFLKSDDLVEFLKSDDRYEFRSFDAIKRHFDGWSAEDVRSLLAIAQSTDDVIRRTRADGTSVYKAV